MADEAKTPEHGEADEEAIELDDAAVERRDAALSAIVQFGDPVLRSRASEVTDFGAELIAEAECMITLMDDAIGTGLAATQIGVLRRFLVYRPERDEEPIALANPEIVWSGDQKEVGEEGCLSIQGVVLEIERPVSVRVVAKDPLGEDVEIEAEGREARVIQHEIDHLDGVLILDRAPVDQRRGAMKALREGRVYWPPDSGEDAASDEDESEA